MWMPLTLLTGRYKRHEGPRYADIHARAVAGALDVSMLYFLLNTPFQWITETLYAGIDRGAIQQVNHATSATQMVRVVIESGLAEVWLLNSLIQVGLIGVFYTSVQITRGTTPGRWLLGLRVVRADTLEPIHGLRYILRFFAYFASFLPLMIGVFWASFNKQHRCFHDYLVGTVVIQERGYEWYKIKAKQLYARVRGRSATVEQPVSEPPTSKGE